MGHHATATVALYGAPDYYFGRVYQSIGVRNPSSSNYNLQVKGTQRITNMHVAETSSASGD